MPYIHERNSAQRRGIVTEVFNSPTTGTTSALELDSLTQLVVALKTANNSISVQIQGSVTNTATGSEWANIGSAIVAQSGTVQTIPFPYLRIVVVTNTATAKTASSLTQTAGTATFTSATHGFVAGDVVTIAGANQAGYNGVKTILTNDTNTFTFAVDAATVSPATTGSSITASGHLRIYVSE